MDIKSQVYKVFAEVFKIPVEEIKKDMTSADVEEWDSLGQLNLIIAVENKFGIKFEVEDIFNITTVDSIIKIVSKKVDT